MKAQGLSMSILVVMAVAVMVLLILGVFFTGGFRKVATSMMDFISGTSDESAKDAVVCNSWCTSNISGSANEANRPEGCTC